jgi:hypothetical protein
LGTLNNTTFNQDATISKDIQGTTNARFQQDVDPQIDSPELTGGSLSIGGTTFNDRNGDGFRTQDEPGLPGWTVILDHDGKEVRTTTNDSGRYIFSNLEAGRYTVTENMVSEWSQTSPGAGNYTINLVDRDAINYNFGNILGHNTYVPQKHPVMGKDAWNQRTQAIKNLPEAGISPEGLAGVSYPSSFSLLSHIPYLGSERDQGSCGNCWVWGCMAPIEIAHDVQNGVHDRLSIQYLNSNYNGGSGYSWACCGGWEGGFQNFFNTQGKFIPWSNSNANYQDGWRQCSDGTSVPASSISTTPNYPITSIQWHGIQTAGVGTTQAISNIKSYLYANKAVTMAFYLPDFQPFWSFWSSNSGNWNPDSYCGLSDGAYPGGHEVTVVGWDDSTDSWIVLNSWGVDSAHPNGTFKLKMDMNYNCARGGSYSYSFGYFDVAFSNANRPPNTPIIPSGPSSGAPGTSYSYSTSATEPDGDQVKYTFDWGDGTTLITGLVNTGTSASASHSWVTAGTYQVKTMATDNKGASSGWSNPLSVSIANSVYGWNSLLGYVTSSPSVIVDNLGKTEVWVKYGDNSLCVNIDGTWYGAGGVLTSDPFAAKDYNGKIHVLVRGNDYSVWDFIYDPAASTGHWKGLGGYITSGPTGAMEPTYHNFLRVAAKGGDNALWQCDLNINTETTNWYTNGGILTSGPYVIFDPAGQQHTLVRRDDNALWDCEGMLGSDTLYHWTWSNLGGILTSGPTACIEPTWTNYVAVFAKGGDNALWMNSVYSATQPETGNWIKLGGVISSDPFAVADTSANKIHVFARGGDSALWENIFSTSPWNPNGNRWQGIGGSILTYTPGVGIGSNTQAFVIGTDHALWRNTHITLSAASSGGDSSQKQEELKHVNYPIGDPNSGGGKS